jgi:sugar phosphate permease
LIGFAAITVSCALMGFTPHFWVVWIGMLAMGVGIGLVIPCLQTSVIQRVSSRGRGRALGIFTSANYIGQFLCPFWAQVFLLQGGHLSLFKACTGIGIALTLGVGLLVWLRLVSEDEVTGVGVPSVEPHPTRDASDSGRDKQSS